MSRQSPYAPALNTVVLVRGPVFLGGEVACTVTAVLADDLINVQAPDGRDLLGLEYDDAQTAIPYAYWRHAPETAEQPAAVEQSTDGPQAPPADPIVAGSAADATQGPAVTQ